MLIDHFNLPVTDLDISLEFYNTVLNVLDCPYLCKDQDCHGFGKDHWEFGIFQVKKVNQPLHVAFVAESADVVELFHQSAIGLGAKSNGDAGFRREYGINYFAAFVFDPDGHNIEAVCRV